MNIKALKKSAALILTVLSATYCVSCAGTPIQDTDRFGEYSPVSSSEKTDLFSSEESSESDFSENDSSSVAEKQSGKTSAHFVCAGDNLIHDNIYVEALKKGGGTEYDFSDCYEHIKKYIKGADIAVLNQETLVTDSYEPTSYPTFCSPTAVGDEVTDDVGFNVISMCNNHVLDKGEDGLISSLDYWDSKNVVHYGAYRSQEDSENIRTMTVNGITFAFLGYMEHTNGLSLSGGDAKVIYLSDEATIKRQIEAADKKADVVVVSCHYGTEIMNEINTQQQTLTPKLVEWGADLIIGTQAHTISTCGYLDKPDGGQAFVYYGLGNFFSTMYDTKSLVGIIGDLDVVKNYDTNEITFENVKAIPVISHFEADYYDSYWYNCTVYPYSQYTDELLSKNFVEGFTRQTIKDCLSYIPEEFLSID